MQQNKRARAPLRGDLGPSLLLQRGERQSERIAIGATGEAERARRADPLNRIGLGGPIEAATRRLAAERLRDLADAAAGQRGERVEPVGGTRDPLALFAAERHLAARLAYAAAWAAIGPVFAGVVQWVVIGWGSLDGFARCRRLRDDTARAWLLAGLDRIP